MNAIAHKNYATLTPIQIRVYDDKIMIANDCVFPEDWTVENLMKPHKSRPYNPLIASTFYRAGYIESWGRGIEKIKESCEASKNPQPEYLIHHEDFMITFFAGKTTQTPTQTSTQTELSELVLAVIREHPEYSQKQIAEQLDWKRDRVKYYVKRLKDEKIIRRVGTTHKGYWEII
ncbi:ATP-binding protein [Ruminococcus flavefaciens]|uniref:ATP-binding protein n=1 Tax=Ruminococcus flavefaciens TaxID=1265 RepID=UPI0026ED4795|nr:ATP-binding protein [Ruminococcus flavefaciens]